MIEQRDDVVTSTALQQQQFLTVLSRDEAVMRFEAALAPTPLGREEVNLSDALGRVLDDEIIASMDVPPFDRSLVDGFAVQAADLVEASISSPANLQLNQEIISAGTTPTIAVSLGTATAIATGGPIPRGADAVVMIEHTEASTLTPNAEIVVQRPVSPGQNIGFAGSDIVRGETVLRRGAVIGSREISMLAACGVDKVPVIRRPRVGVIATGNELVAQGMPLRTGTIYDSNNPMICAAVSESGGIPANYGIVCDDEAALRGTIMHSLAECDMVILSGGTSKGAGDLTYKLLADLGPPGIIVHGVAVKPGKPLCLAVCDRKPVIVLPGFPTSAMFTFFDVVAPLISRLAGLPERRRAHISANVPVHVPSELGRTEYVMVSLVERENGVVAYPLDKGSGSVSTFAQSDGFLCVDALADAVPAGTSADVVLLSSRSRIPDLVITGSHCLGLDMVVNHLTSSGHIVRLIAVGSLGGLAAARRGECDVAPIHLMDPTTGLYNCSYVSPGLELIKGWTRMQGLIFRKGDVRFDGAGPEMALATALSDPDCHMVNRNQGSGTRILVDKMLKGATPTGYWKQPRSHNSVAATIAHRNADWGIAIVPVAEAYGLEFIPIAEEHYDFVLVSERRYHPAVGAFIEALDSSVVHAELRRLGFRRSSEV
ncbi:molybdopterin biosynthesis protein (plasmid) [Microvirga terrae]|uniref:Molybdopterin molybdenumtransferase n=1 Tax=Microvirga terrae TaxID=2740529 RepID=A0ABY5RY23_9HYPH|nr:molybdopterin biosynthesis protein [Microvirga terrae]UVF22181.1 molybdopterin biosynthesis protein [Microvirga terrae]